MGEFTLVISTGGTIAATADETGAFVPTLSADELVRRSFTDKPVRTFDAERLDSSSIGFAQIDSLRQLVGQMLGDDRVTSIVITHGTDSIAETALALDLVHSDPRPIVLTGAMRPADDERPDGPENLRRAIDVAADRLRRGTGVLVHFGGETYPARGLIKADTSDLRPFALSSARPLPRATPVSASTLEGLNIPIVRAWAGADGRLVRDVAKQSPDGVVIEALGAGNVAAEMGEAIAELARDTPVVLTTSVPFGEVSLAYGGAGGGASLGDAGVLSAGFLRAGQARIALATALSAGVDPRVLL